MKLDRRTRQKIRDVLPNGHIVTAIKHAQPGDRFVGMGKTVIAIETIPGRAGRRRLTLCDAAGIVETVVWCANARMVLERAPRP